jgi:uncharacterized protein
VILLDVNVVLAAHRDDHSHYKTVRPWFDHLLESNAQFSVPNIVWSSFIRIATNRRIFTVPTPIKDAFDFLRAVTSQPEYITIDSDINHLELFEEICIEYDVAGDLTADAYLATLAIANGATLVSFDRDFARFSRVKWSVPIIQEQQG